MIEKIKNSIKKHRLFKSGDRLLVAVSGGVDSMVLLVLLSELGVECVVAHCNFQLRGEDANQDEEFVQATCKAKGLKSLVERFNTSDYALSKGISIQMAARELRYNWFETLLSEYNCDYIVTAHHQNDVAETMLINLTSGTGLAGLTGIKPKNGKIIRPLLSLSRKEIEHYASQHNIDYREDCSNFDEKYMRNAIRHQVVPRLEALNPQFIQHANNTAGYLTEIEAILNSKIQEEANKCMRSENNQTMINIEKLKALHPRRAYLYYFLCPFGFNESQVDDVLQAIEGQSGKQFHTSNFEMVKDRDELIIRPIKEIDKQYINIETLEGFQSAGIEAEVKQNTDVVFGDDNSFAYLDFDQLIFPLQLRSWEFGDRFQPLGMQGQKKVSDFLVDVKMSLSAKGDVRVLETANQICWLVGQRVDDNFKVTSNTKNILVLKSKASC